ncbi:uncharacterized protein GGS22DRAFT_165990 [Annulohypoxylon maeteangense]|uniref:uncharacterized protein n=1 Tax=Annulohypoxylon maeteangense TaxID=1927788 RepID=UPI00200743A5|nr:uncharacterized protein GGS22DRAFT_165990 [Annulohypoxylon maeteangense]KAI0883745.1 hypothetical protein GGS22DRAFT_165990 [Annulohypoxylon maeteangense]
MPVYHIVLFRLKKGVAPDVLDDFTTRAKAMVGQVPGLTKVDIGPPLAVTAHRSNGFDMGVVAVLGKQEDLAGYATHPAHMYAHELREQLCEETLVYDLEVPA